MIFSVPQSTIMPVSYAHLHKAECSVRSWWLLSYSRIILHFCNTCVHYFVNKNTSLFAVSGHMNPVHKFAHRITLKSILILLSFHLNLIPNWPLCCRFPDENVVCVFCLSHAYMSRQYHPTYFGENILKYVYCRKHSSLFASLQQPIRLYIKKHESYVSCTMNIIQQTCFL